MKRMGAPTEDKKICSNCRELLHNEDFKKDKRRSTGTGAICNECSANASKIRRSMKMDPEHALSVSLKELYKITDPKTKRERQQWDVVLLSLERLKTKKRRAK